jgi:hypothetical protein
MLGHSPAAHLPSNNDNGSEIGIGGKTFLMGPNTSVSDGSLFASLVSLWSPPDSAQSWINGGASR